LLQTRAPVRFELARGESRIGKSVASSEGAVGGADLSVRPLLRVAELLEAVPGPDSRAAEPRTLRVGMKWELGGAR
jgi:hypothetical protein